MSNGKVGWLGPVARPFLPDLGFRHYLNFVHPLAQTPDGWRHSSWRGYARRAAREDFVQYDLLHDAWMDEERTGFVWLYVRK